MKTACAYACVLAVVASLAACGGDDEPEATTPLNAESLVGDWRLAQRSTAYTYTSATYGDYATAEVHDDIDVTYSFAADGTWSAQGTYLADVRTTGRISVDTVREARENERGTYAVSGDTLLLTATYPSPPSLKPSVTWTYLATLRADERRLTLDGGYAEVWEGALLVDGQYVDQAATGVDERELVLER